MSDEPEAEPSESDLLFAVLELPTEQREAYLDRACRGRPTLRARVRQLLRNAETGGDFMQGPALDLSTADALDSFDVGRRIGRYRLMEQIGEGGMGIVFVAVQSEPIARKVALKVIKPGMDSKSVIARFEAERQALAMMDHPHIAKVFDAGTADGRLPYFVMELVRGMSITAYCDGAKSTIADRLRLFQDVCAAVQHAHQKGIIHRDLKPGNILVTVNDGKPVVKVIDFGVAKALHTPMTEQLVYTALHQVLGTPLYMSPEQLELSGIDIDTRSDIYSLGVLLYELLSGKLPFERERLLGSGFDEMRRIIREEDPPRPSQRVTTLPKAEQSTVAETRGLDLRELPKTIRSELDWISLKALSRDRNRRYQTASELAEDIRRYLDDVPVLACPPSYRYLAGKVFRKHRRLIVSSSVLALSLIVGTVVSVGQATRAIRAEKDLGEQLREVTVEQSRTRQALAAVSVAESKQRELRLAAEASAAQASRAAENERSLREQAESAVRQASWNLYVANLATMQTAFDERNFGRLDALLRKSTPAAGEIDYRGWEWYYLERCVRESSIPVPPIDGQVPRLRVAFNPVADELAVFTDTGVVEIRDSNSLSRLARYDVGSSLETLSWSPDGQQIALGTHDSGELIVLDRLDGRRVWQSQPIDIRSVRVDGRRIGGLTWSPDGGRLAIGTRSADIAVVDLEARTTVVIRKANENDILEDVAWHPLEDRLLVGLRYGERRILDLASRKSVELAYRSDVIGEAVAWNPSGTLAATGEGRRLRIANAAGEDHAMLDGHSSGITDVAWIDDRRCVSVSRDRSIRWWDVESCRQLQVRYPFDEPSYALSLSHDGKRLAIASGLGVRIISVDSSFEFDRQVGLQGTVDELQWSPDGSHLYTNGLFDAGDRWIGAASLLDGATLRLLNESINERGRGFRWMPDSGFIVQALDGGQWQVTDPRSLAGFQRMRQATGDRAQSVWSPDGLRVMTGDDRSSPILRDAKTAEPTQEWSIDSMHAMTRGAWDPTSSRFLTGGRSQPLLLHIDGRSVGYPTLQAFDNHGIAWHPSGEVFALGNDQGTISIREPDRLEPILFLNGHHADIRGLDFSPDGTRLASASFDGTIRLWDVATGRELLRLTAPGATGFSAVRWSPDGRLLAAGTSDRSVVLFGPAEASETTAPPAVPTHGAVYRRFVQSEAAEHYRRSIPPAPSRVPLEQLLGRFRQVTDPAALDLTSLLAPWFVTSDESGDSFEHRVTAVVRFVDASTDDRVAIRLGQAGLELLERPVPDGDPRTRRSLANQLRFARVHRLARSAESTEVLAELNAAIESEADFANEFALESDDWYRRISLETLRANLEVERYVRAIAEPDEVGDSDRLTRTLDEYREFLTRVPASVMPLVAPFDAQSIRDVWVRAVSQEEIRFDRRPTYAQEWPGSIEREILARSSVDLFYLSALSRLAVGDADGYRETCRTMLARLPETEDPSDASLLVWTACLVPSVDADYGALRERFRSVDGEPQNGIESGLLDYRNGDTDLARGTLERLIELEKPDEPGTGIETRYLLALVEASAGNRDAARRWFGMAEALVTERLGTPAARRNVAWTRIVQWKLLRAEVDQTLSEESDD